MGRALFVILGLASVGLYGCGDSLTRVAHRTDGPYAVIVDYSLSLEEMIDRGSYDYVSYSLRDIDATFIRQDKAEICVIVVYFPGEIMHTEEVVDFIYNLAMRPARIEELLATRIFHQSSSATLPRVDTPFRTGQSLIALDVAYASGNDDPVFFPEISAVGFGHNRRTLTLANSNNEWHGATHFLVVADCPSQMSE